MAREAEPICCESGYGFEPELVARSCGFSAYLGESEELACVHRFADGHGVTHELRISPVFDLELGQAIALHESGEFGDGHTAGYLAERSDVWLSRTAMHEWALLGGWPVLRRLSWDPQACSEADMLPVLEAMADAASEELVSPLPRMANEAAPRQPQSESLLDRYAAASPGAIGFSLPHGAAALIDASMTALARGELEAWRSYLAEDARWGLPDRRQIGARAVAGDGGAAAFEALRSAASRLPVDAELHCPALDRRIEASVRRGEAAMWCVWGSEDRLDLLVFGLRGGLQGGVPTANIVYVGLFAERPLAALRVPGEPPPPPAQPRPRLVCGDPHVVDYPGLCSRSTEDIEEDEEDEGDEGDEGDELEDDELENPEGPSTAIDEQGSTAVEEGLDEIDVAGVTDLDRQQ